MNHMVTSVGADYGGTWIRIIGVSQKGKEIRFLKIPSRPITKLPSLLRKILNQWDIKNLKSLTVSAKGIWKKKKRVFLLNHLKNQKLAENIIVLPDIEAVYRSIFGNQHGIAVISGTGSIAYGKDSCGKKARAGGHNPKNGDKGSGKWLGIHYSRFNHKKLISEKISDPAKQAIESAEKGNRKSEKIVFKAAQDLVDLVNQVQQKLRLKKKIKVGTAGGLLENQYFRRIFKKSLKQNLKNRSFQIISLKQPIEKYCALAGIG